MASFNPSARSKDIKTGLKSKNIERISVFPYNEWILFAVRKL